MHHGDISEDIAQGLKVLRQRIEAAKIPSSKLDETFNLATWNIREFGKKKRLKASLHYIAEILGQFDLIAVVEVRDDVSELAEVLRILGPYWSVVYSDYIADPGGNRERVAYVFDKRAVRFTGLASEADPPRRKVDGEYLPEISWWRAPYMASFAAGNFDFVLLSAHIRWGDSAEGRVPELKLLAEWVDKRMKDKTVDQDWIVMGDFNIPSVKATDALYQAITSKGLRMPAALANPAVKGSNLAANKRYDQILHYPAHTQSFTKKGGVLDFYAGDHQSLYPSKQLTKDKFTYELSDHLPLWMQVNCDLADERLDQILGTT